jgi:hypothetical protein
VYISYVSRLSARYSILPHNDGYDASAANRFGLEQARPLIVSAVKEDITVTAPEF